MKKILSILLLAVMAVAFVSCSSNSPKAVVEKVLSLQKQQKYEETVDFIGDKEGNAITKEQADQLKAMIQSKASHETKIVSYEIVSEEIDEDGKHAVVKTSVTYEDERTKEETTNLIKGDDGVWRISIGK